MRNFPKDQNDRFGQKKILTFDKNTLWVKLRVCFLPEEFTVTKNIFVINPFAKQVRTDKTLRARLKSLVYRETTLVEPTSVNQLIEILNSQSKDLSHVTIYIVGGDGTFNQILNWIMTLPPKHRPSLMPVGGGQFNFMARYIGLKNRDPSINLVEVFSGRIDPKPELWRPVQIHDSYTNTNKYSAVVANGLVCSFVKWYEERGKGGVLDVLQLVVIAGTEYIGGMISGHESRISKTSGTISIDNKTLESSKFGGIVVGAVSEFMPTCKPFRSNLTPNTCGTIAYWGEIAVLPFASPTIWFGKSSILTEKHMFNGVSERIEFITSDAKMLLDGDLFEWDNPNITRTFTFSRGPEVTLLRAM